MKKASLQYITVLSVFILVIISCSKSGQLNHPPVVDVGVDETVFLPDQSATIDAVGFDDATAKLDYFWRQVKGPGSANIDDANGSKTIVSGLQKGEYVFEVKVTDAGGLFAKDSIKVEVLDKPSREIMTSVKFTLPCPQVSCSFTIKLSNTVLDNPYKVYVQPDSYTTSWLQAFPANMVINFSDPHPTANTFFYYENAGNDEWITDQITIGTPSWFASTNLRVRIVY